MTSQPIETMPAVVLLSNRQRSTVPDAFVRSPSAEPPVVRLTSHSVSVSEAPSSPVIAASPDMFSTRHFSSRTRAPRRMAAAGIDEK